ncbi:MAG TPA: NAD(P)H-dependent oxidoreductase [Candidatus Saccharimonadales bacterium]
MPDIPLTALVINCTLKPSPSDSSADKLANELLVEFASQGVAGTILRAADYAIKPGVETDMGDGDEWPEIRQKMLDADILVIATPIWLGHPTSFVQRILERLDAELGEADDNGHYPTYGKVAAAAVVGNEDGAHHVSAELYQGLNDVGFSLAPNAVTYWTGHAMGSTDYKDLKTTPEEVKTATHMVAVNTAHLARVLKMDPLPSLT